MTTRDGDATAAGSRGGDDGRARRGRLVRGCALVVAGSSLWGVAGTVAKVLMQRTGMDPLWLTCVKMCSASAIFFCMAARRTPGRLRLFLREVREPRRLPGLLAMAAMAYLVLNASYFANVSITNSATATVLQSLGIPMVLAYVCLREGRVPYGREVVGFAFALAGTWFLATEGDPTQLTMPALGLAMGLLTALGQASMTIMPVRHVERYGSLVVNGFGFLVAGVALLAWTRPWAGAPMLDALDWAMLLFSILVGSFGANGLYMQGLKEIGSVRTTLLSTSEQVAATVSTVVMTGVLFSPAELLGIALLTVMVMLMA